MDEHRAKRCDEWLARLSAWAGYSTRNRHIAIACEVVRGIVAVDEPEWVAAVEWARGEPSVEEWVEALVMYGPVQRPEERQSKAVDAYTAATYRNQRAIRAAVR